MKKFERYSLAQPWVMASLLSVMLAGCGGGESGLTGAALTPGKAAASSVRGEGPAPVDLRSAGTFAILSKTGITNVYASAITGMLERARSRVLPCFSRVGK